MIEGKSFSEIFSSPDRWYQGALFADSNGKLTGGEPEKTEKCCLVGARELLSEKLTNDDKAWIAISDALYQAVSEVSGIPEDQLIIQAYNDAPWRTFEDIQRIAKRADKILREKGIIK